MEVSIRQTNGGKALGEEWIAVEMVKAFGECGSDVVVPLEIR